MKVAEDENCHGCPHVALRKTTQSSSELGHVGALLHTFGVLDTNALRQLGWIQTNNRFKLSASQRKVTVFGKPDHKMTTVK